MKLLDYYQEEILALNRDSVEFARAFPDKARELGMNGETGRDPTVERLLEGFAFVAARIRQHLDLQAPRLFDSLLSNVAPHLTHALPSCCILEFTPRKGLLQQTRTVPAGAIVHSAPSGPESTPCRFSTAFDLPVRPLTIENLTVLTDQSGRDTITITMRTERGAVWSGADMHPLRLFCAAEFSDAALLHSILTTCVESAAISLDNSPALIIPGPYAVTPAFCTPRDTLLHWLDAPYRGLGLAIEYFAFAEKFLFLDIHGFDRLPTTPKAPALITWSAVLTKSHPALCPVGPHSVKLHCVPAVNLFEHTGEPILDTGRKQEYPLEPDRDRPQSIHPHSVVAIRAIDRASGARTQLTPAHPHKPEIPGAESSYRVLRDRAPGGAPAFRLAITGNRSTPDYAIKERVLSCALRCTNGTLPCELPAQYKIDMPGSHAPQWATVRNCTRPTLPAQPPDPALAAELFDSHLCATCGALSAPGALVSLLLACDFSGLSLRRRPIEAITQVTAEPATVIHQNAAAQAVRFTLTISQTAGVAEPELRLCGRVIHAALSQYVPINTLLDLELRLSPSGTCLRFGPQEGSRWLL